MSSDKPPFLDLIHITRLSGSLSGSAMAGLTPVLPVMFTLMPLKAWFPILGPVKNAITEVFDNLTTSLFELFGVFFVGLLRPMLFFTPPGEIEALNTYYDSLLGLFVVLLFLGSAVYVFTAMLYPDSDKSSFFRLGERAIAGIFALFTIRPIFDLTVVITNGVGRYLLGDSYSIEFIGAGFKELAKAGGAEALGIFVFAIFGSISTLFTVGLFYVVLAMRMLVVYAAYALLPLLIGMWIVDIGPMKYANQGASLIFKGVSILLIFSILIPGVLAAGDAIGGQSAQEQVDILNDSNTTNGTVGELQTAAGASSGENGPSRGGDFQEAGSDSNPDVDEAGVMTKILGYLGSMWVVIILTYSGMGVLIQTGSTSRHAGQSTQPVSEDSTSDYGGGGVVKETDDGGMILQDPKTGRGVYMGKDGQTSMFGGEDGARGDSSALANGNVGGDQLTDVSIGGAGSNSPDGVVDSDDESFGGTSMDSGTGVGSGAAPLDESNGLEPMSLREKGTSIASAPRDWIGGGIEAVGSAAERSGFDQSGEALRKTGEGIQERITREGAADAARYGATFGGKFSVDEDSGTFHRAMGKAVGGAGRATKGIGRLVKGSGVTYGKMFAEEDPVRATQIGIDGMRRSPIGDPRRSNVTGELKEEFQPEAVKGSGDESTSEESASGDTGRAGPVGPFQSSDRYQEEGYQYGADSTVPSPAGTAGAGSSSDGDGNDESTLESYSGSYTASAGRLDLLENVERAPMVPVFSDVSSYDDFEDQIEGAVDDFEEYGIEGGTREELQTALSHQQNIGASPEVAVDRLNLLANYSDLDPVGERSVSEGAHEVGVPTLPENLDTDHARARINLGESDHVTGGANDDLMSVYEFDNDEKYVIGKELETNPEAGIGNVVSNEVLTELGGNSPEMHYDVDQDYLRIEGVRGENIGTMLDAVSDDATTEVSDLAVDPADIDEESFVDAVAGKTLMGNFDVTEDNLRVAESGQVYSIDDDDVGGGRIAEIVEEGTLEGGPHQRAIEQAEQLGMDVSKDDVDDRVVAMAEQLKQDGTIDELREKVEQDLGEGLSEEELVEADSGVQEIQRQLDERKGQTSEALDVIEQNATTVTNEDFSWEN